MSRKIPVLVLTLLLVVLGLVLLPVIWEWGYTYNWYEVWPDRDQIEIRGQYYNRWDEWLGRSSPNSRVGIELFWDSQERDDLDVLAVTADEVFPYERYGWIEIATDHGGPGHVKPFTTTHYRLSGVVCLQYRTYGKHAEAPPWPYPVIFDREAILEHIHAAKREVQYEAKRTGVALPRYWKRVE
ncbi:MAG: hypothetical protein AAF581_06650 [Planctomycetota bacterium]